MKRVEDSSGCNATPCEGSHHLVNLQVCVFVAPSTRVKRGEGGVTHPVVRRVLPALPPPLLGTPTLTAAFVKERITAW